MSYPPVRGSDRRAAPGYRTWRFIYVASQDTIAFGTQRLLGEHRLQTLGRGSALRPARLFGVAAEVALDGPAEHLVTHGPTPAGGSPCTGRRRGRVTPCPRTDRWSEAPPTAAPQRVRRARARHHADPTPIDPADPSPRPPAEVAFGALVEPACCSVGCVCGAGGHARAIAAATMDQRAVRYAGVSDNAVRPDSTPGRPLTDDQRGDTTTTGPLAGPDGAGFCATGAGTAGRHPTGGSHPRTHTPEAALRRALDNDARSRTSRSTATRSRTPPAIPATSTTPRTARSTRSTTSGSSTTGTGPSTAPGAAADGSRPPPLRSQRIPGRGRTVPG